MTLQTHRSRLTLKLALVASLVGAVAPTLAQSKADSPRTADYIVAVVNQELVTSAELQLRMAQVREEARRNRATVPGDDELRRQMLEALINERVQITYARDAGQKVEDGDLDRAVANVAAQNQITLPQLRERLRSEGIDYTRFRHNIRDQMQLERVREREVQARVRVSDADIDAWIAAQRTQAAATVQYNIGQIFVSVAEGATERVVAERRSRAETALARVQRGDSFSAVAAELSDDSNRSRGGELGLRPASALPDVFVEAMSRLKPGEISPAVLRSPAGFHVLKLVSQAAGEAFVVTQTRARHILLRQSAQSTPEAAARRLVEIKKQIEDGKKTFEQAAREYSEDGSAPQGGDLGWASPGGFVPEFEEVMNSLAPGAISSPVQSRFGVHLIQVQERRSTRLDAKQQREQARNVLREQKYDEAATEWVRDLRVRAYVELREPPQ